MLVRLSLAAVVLLGAVMPLEAQMQGPMQPRGQQMGRPMQPGRQQMPQGAQPIEIQGTIEEIMRGVVVVLDATSQPWQVMLPANTKVQVIGGASVDYLQNGMFVEFHGDIDGHGNLKEKVEGVTIVTLSPEKQAGLFPLESDKAGDEPGDFGAGEGGKAKPARGGKAGGSIAGTYRIIGKLTVGRGGKLSVQTGRGTLPLELAEDATVAVDVSDYTIAAKGDKITVKGIASPAMQGRAQAVDVKIELAELLAGAAKKKPGKPDAKKPSKRSKKDKDEGLPEPADDR